ncbi:MAG TPA: hypothetical protein VLW53_14450 [Candidatus Eisenbacteria bacterium]|nr:hypothetical protein [Candidatus Eisenbacteria bacterium]
MGSSRPKTTIVRRSAAVAAALALVGLVAAGCGGGSSSTSSTATTPAASASTSAGGAALTVQTRSGSLGTYLTDGNGRTLYLLTADQGSTSTCSGGCASVWPPLLASGTVKAGAGASSGQLTSATGPNGKQVTYAGHPLYYYTGDSKAGDVNGQGISSYGGQWWVVGADGNAIQTSGGSSGGSSSGRGY